MYLSWIELGFWAPLGSRVQVYHGCRVKDESVLSPVASCAPVTSHGSKQEGLGGRGSWYQLATQRVPDRSNGTYRDECMEGHDHNTTTHGTHQGETGIQAYPTDSAERKRNKKTQQKNVVKNGSKKNS